MLLHSIATARSTLCSAVKVSKLAYLLSKGLSPSECRKALSAGSLERSTGDAQNARQAMQENLRGEMFSPAKTLDTGLQAAGAAASCLLGQMSLRSNSASLCSGCFLLLDGFAKSAQPMSALMK